MAARPTSGATWTVKLSRCVCIKLYSKGVESGDSQADADRKRSVIARGELILLDSYGEEETFFTVSFPLQEESTPEGKKGQQPSK